MSKPLFHLIRSCTKIIEFDNVNFLKQIYGKMVFLENFLRLTVMVRLQKMSASKA